MAKKNKIEKVNISDFMDNDYGDKYAKYTIQERAIPSVIDGLKTSYRKALYASMSFMKKGVSVSGLEIVGETYKKASYHHGNSSLENVITLLGATYTNNTAPLVVNGSGGDLRNTDASAIRYLKFTLSDKIQMYDVDTDILEYNYDGDKRLEPTHYLPLIPTILASRSSGVAVGFAFANNISFSLKSILDATISELNNLSKKQNKDLPEMIPYVEGYDNGFVNMGEDCYKTSSEYKIVSGKKVVITGLPIDQTFEKFESNLSKLVEKEKILNFTNDGFEKYTVHMNPSTMKNLTKNGNERLEKLLKIGNTTHKNVYYFLDENDRIIDNLYNAHDVVRYFVKYRLSRYTDRKKLLIKNINKKIQKTDDMSRFIKFVIDGKLELRNRPIKEVKSFLTKEKINHDVLQVNITKITKEEYQKLLKELVLLKKELETTTNTTIDKMYMTDLKALQKIV